MIHTYTHWRQSALNSAGALQGGDGEFRGIFTPFYTINFRVSPWTMDNGAKLGDATVARAPPLLSPP